MAPRGGKRVPGETGRAPGGNPGIAASAVAASVPRARLPLCSSRAEARGALSLRVWLWHVNLCTSSTKVRARRLILIRGSALPPCSRLLCPAASSHVLPLRSAPRGAGGGCEPSPVPEGASARAHFSRPLTKTLGGFTSSSGEGGRGRGLRGTPVRGGGWMSVSYQT